MVSNEFHGVTISDLLRDWPTYLSIRLPNIKNHVLMWMPPLHGIQKINFHGSSICNPGPIGFGCIIRDCDSLTVCVTCGPMGSCDYKSGGFCVIDGVA